MRRAPTPIAPASPEAKAPRAKRLAPPKPTAKPRAAAKPAAEAKPVADAKPGLHPRNRHQGRYDFPALIAACPALKRHVTTTPAGERTIDFADPVAVQALNQALLQSMYDVRGWELPTGYLCPPIPGRADYLHHLADLLASANGGSIPRGPKVRVFDLGVGASAIYPLIGTREYGWSFVGADCDPDALASAQRIIRANPGLERMLELRRQSAPARAYAGVVAQDEHFDLAMCNPPFHASAAEASAGTRRKWHNLGKPGAARRATPLLNFGGRDSELWCPGGEVGFITRMISESAQVPGLCLWHSALVSKEASVPLLVRALQGAHVRERRVIELAHGQKRSRIICWTFLDERQRRDWRGARWG